MKKYIKFFEAAVLAAFLALPLVSCEKGDGDDDDESGLIGTWYAETDIWGTYPEEGFGSGGNTPNTPEQGDSDDAGGFGSGSGTRAAHSDDEVIIGHAKIYQQFRADGVWRTVEIAEYDEKWNETSDTYIEEGKYRLSGKQIVLLENDGTEDEYADDLFYEVDGDKLQFTVVCNHGDTPETTSMTFTRVSNSVIDKYFK